MKISTLGVDALSFLFVVTPTNRKVIPNEEKFEEDTPTKQRRIRCPLCGWQPDGQPHWQCERCFVQFDTFKTHAHCPTPNCGNAWIYTQCIACHKLSLHEQWYENGE